MNLRRLGPTVWGLILGVVVSVAVFLIGRSIPADPTGKWYWLTYAIPTLLALSLWGMVIYIALGAQQAEWVMGMRTPLSVVMFGPVGVFWERIWAGLRTRSNLKQAHVRALLGTILLLWVEYFFIRIKWLEPIVMFHPVRFLLEILFWYALVWICLLIGWVLRGMFDTKSPFSRHHQWSNQTDWLKVVKSVPWHLPFPISIGLAIHGSLGHVGTAVSAAILLHFAMLVAASFHYRREQVLWIANFDPLDRSDIDYTELPGRHLTGRPKDKV